MFIYNLIMLQNLVKAVIVDNYKILVACMGNVKVQTRIGGQLHDSNKKCFMRSSQLCRHRAEELLEIVHADVYGRESLSI